MSQPMSHMTIVNDDCTICPDPVEEVGAVLKDEDGVAACEGCRREGKA